MFFKKEPPSFAQVVFSLRLIAFKTDWSQSRCRLAPRRVVGRYIV